MCRLRPSADESSDDVTPAWASVLSHSTSTHSAPHVRNLPNMRESWKRRRRSMRRPRSLARVRKRTGPGVRAAGPRPLLAGARSSGRGGAVARGSRAVGVHGLRASARGGGRPPRLSRDRSAKEAVGGVSEPSTSMKRKVTVPVGRLFRTRLDHPPGLQLAPSLHRGLWRQDPRLPECAGMSLEPMQRSRLECG